jgi:hypothetical protein
MVLAVFCLSYLIMIGLSCLLFRFLSVSPPVVVVSPSTLHSSYIIFHYSFPAIDLLRIYLARSSQA